MFNRGIIGALAIAQIDMFNTNRTADDSPRALDALTTREHSDQRQRAELRAGEPEGDPADHVDRPDGSRG
jgi:hypothetical protein